MLPQPLYEGLPYLYIISGLSSIIGLDTPGGKLCGLLLMTAGIVVHQIRARYRHPVKPPPPRNSHPHERQHYPSRYH